MDCRESDFKNKYQERYESDYNMVFHEWRFRRGCPGRGGVSRLDELVSKVPCRAFFLQAYHYERIKSHEFFNKFITTIRLIIFYYIVNKYITKISCVTYTLLNNINYYFAIKVFIFLV